MLLVIRTTIPQRLSWKSTKRPTQGKLMASPRRPLKEGRVGNSTKVIKRWKTVTKSLSHITPTTSNTRYGHTRMMFGGNQEWCWFAKPVMESLQPQNLWNNISAGMVNAFSLFQLWYRTLKRFWPTLRRFWHILAVPFGWMVRYVDQ